MGDKRDSAGPCRPSFLVAGRGPAWAGTTGLAAEFRLCMDLDMSAGLKLRVDGVVPNRHLALRYAGGLTVIHVALGISVP
jgi:hypothetical protein